jgi:hypothetical protein
MVAARSRTVTDAENRIAESSRAEMAIFAKSRSLIDQSQFTLASSDYSGGADRSIDDIADREKNAEIIQHQKKEYRKGD